MIPLEMAYSRNKACRMICSLRVGNQMEYLGMWLCGKDTQATIEIILVKMRDAMIQPFDFGTKTWKIGQTSGSIE